MTKITLDPSRRLARKYLGSPQVMHAVVLKASGGGGTDGPGRVLWRVDQGQTTSLYVQSPQAPDCAQILEEAGLPGSQAQTLDYEPFLARLSEGQLWGFRLTANPSRAISQGPGVRGKRSGHVTVEQQRQWLITRAPGLGFDLVPASNDDESGSLLTVVRRNRPVFGRENPYQGGRDRVTINQTVYEGVLQVRDVDMLRRSLVAGIGRSKAYGCGLMTLARDRRG
nr:MULTISPECIES: type I-E CRISPR-associated protein Cas6/Cse3/CasE [unclassified Actinomyces]